MITYRHNFTVLNLTRANNLKCNEFYFSFITPNLNIAIFCRRPRFQGVGDQEEGRMGHQKKLAQEKEA